MATEIKTSYFICATPRSGSTLLCDLLTRTGVAGNPESYFRRQSIPTWIEALKIPRDQRGGGPEIDRAYLAAVKREGTSRNGVFGARVMWESLPELAGRLEALFPGLPSDAARLRAAFGNAAFIHLSRDDKVGQAVSLARAMQNGLWHRNADGSERERLQPLHPAGYDFAFLDGCFEQLSADDRAWHDWFARQGVEPLSTSYEALARDPQAELAKILAALGQNPEPAKTMQVGTARLANAESRRWSKAFRAEKGLV